MNEYSTNYYPPAPVIKIQISSAEKVVKLEYLGLLDTGADISVIPNHLVKDLKLKPRGEIDAQGYNGEIIRKRFYNANIFLEERSFENVPVISSPVEGMLVGRNMLNQLTILLEGKKLSFQISDP